MSESVESALLIEESVAQFSERLADGTPAPGGGSASALAGALAAALTGMVGRLTAGRPKFAAVDAAMRAICAEADAHRAILLNLVDADALAFGAVMSAFHLPKQSPAESAARLDAIQAAYRTAVDIPLQVTQTAVATLRLLGDVTAHGNPNAISDAGVAALLADAAAQGAALNVRINLTSLRDETFVAATAAQVDDLLAEAARLRRTALAQVEQRLIA